MNSKAILYSKGNNDECYTPEYGVEPILKYIHKGAIVWCPFDKSDSEFVKQISKQNKVVYSHIDNGQDFFTYEPDSWDVIISNPPFSNKRKYFERAISFNKPFALIMSNTWLNDAAPKQLFKHKELQLLMFDKRMKFLNNGTTQNKITFSSSKHCNEQFKPRRRNHLYCTLSCKTMASYERNNYKYVSGRYEKDGTSNKQEEVFEDSSNNNKKIEKKLKGLDKNIASLKQLIEQGQKATSGLLTSTLGPIIARISELTVKKVFWPGTLPATKDDINELKKQNNEISEQNRRLIKHLDEKDQFNSFLN